MANVDTETDGNVDVTDPERYVIRARAFEHPKELRGLHVYVADTYEFLDVHGTVERTHWGLNLHIEPRFKLGNCRFGAMRATLVTRVPGGGDFSTMEDAIRGRYTRAKSALIRFVEHHKSRKTHVYAISKDDIHLAGVRLRQARRSTAFKAVGAVALAIFVGGVGYVFGRLDDPKESSKSLAETSDLGTSSTADAAPSSQS
jgi:hypothetical protein